MLCENSIVLSEGRLKMGGPTHHCIECYNGNSSASGAALMLNVRPEDHDVKIKSIIINGQSSGEIRLTSEENILKVTIEAWLEQPKNIDLEVVLADMNQTHLATFAPSHDQGFTALSPAGEYRVEYFIQLPKRMNKGNFFLHLYLTHFNFAYLTKIENIQLRVEGVPNRAGRIFEYSAGAGLILLDPCA